MLMIDPNFGGSDNYAGLVFDITNPVTSLVAEYAESDRTTEYSRGRVLALADQYRVLALAIESNSGGKIIWENIQRDRPDLNALLTLTTANSKILNTDRVALALEQGEFIYPPDWKGMAEMRGFSARTREAVAGQKDDRIMALAAGFAHLQDVKRTTIGNIGIGRVRR
jgi:phage terminase large subunit-like protein